MISWSFMALSKNCGCFTGDSGPDVKGVRVPGKPFQVFFGLIYMPGLKLM